MAFNPWDAVCGWFGFKQFEAVPASVGREYVELPMRRARRSVVPGQQPRVRAREDRMNRPHCRARHTHCVETRGALFALSVTFEKAFETLRRLSPNIPEATCRSLIGARRTRFREIPERTGSKDRRPDNHRNQRSDRPRVDEAPQE